MKNFILVLLLIFFVGFVAPSCVRKDAKCKKEHKKARKKGTAGWQY